MDASPKGMGDDDRISASRAIHRRTGRTFYTATQLLPRRVRRATYVLYAFFRVADEVVDDDRGLSPAEKRAALARLRAAALGETEPTHPVLGAFADLTSTYDIADGTVERFVDAMATDTTKSRYATYGELEAYMDGSSVAVAEMMLAVMRPEDPERARPHARALAEAFQLTNFLRDVREDVAERDRIYLPRSTLSRHGADERAIRELDPTPGFRAAVRDELERAERRYREGVAGIRFLPEDCRFAVLLAAVLYADYHRAIRRRSYDVLSDPPELGTPRKLRLVAEARLRWTLWKRPERVFHAASAVPVAETRTARANRADGLPIR